MTVTEQPPQEETPSGEAVEATTLEPQPPEEYKSEVLDKIRPASDPGPLKVLIYGSSGVGKTVFACGAPSALLIDAEHGARSLRNHAELLEVPVFPMTTFGELSELFQALLAGAMPEIKTIVVDSLTELANKSLDQILDQNVAKDPTRNRFLPFQQDFNVNTNRMRRLVAQFRDLERNVVFIAHEMEKTDESTQIVTIRPDLSPKFAGALKGVMDLMGRYSADVDEGGQVVKRTLQVHPSRRVNAKTRIGGLPVFLENPNFGMLVEADQKNGRKSEEIEVD